MSETSVFDPYSVCAELFIAVLELNACGFLRVFSLMVCWMV